MAKKKKINRQSRLYQLPVKHKSESDLVTLSKAAGLSTLRFLGRSTNLVAGVRNNWNLRGFILFCFSFAGMASLMDQVLWMRQLGLIFGTTLQAVSTVLAVFMAGLALGSFIFGRIADRTKSPLRLYAFLQIGIGAYVMLTPLIFRVLSSAQVSIYGSLEVGSAGVTALSVLGCFLVLIVPTTLMGGTLPVIAKYFIRRKEELGRGVGNLYFISTLGAVLGALVAGFFLIPYIGVLASTLLAASIDLSIGVGFFFLYKYKLKPAEEAEQMEEEAEEFEEIEEELSGQLSKKQTKRLEREQRKLERLKPPGHSKAMRRVVFIGFAFGGLASLSLEVAWTRVISMVLGSSIYAFSLMLTAFLLGIALGSAIASKFVDKVKHLWVYFFVVQALIGLAVVILNPLLGELPLLFVKVFPGLQQNFWLLQFVEFLLLLLIMLIPTLLMGAAFPIAAKIYTEDMDHMAGSVGRLYAGNTFGSMLGPLLTGFVIIPLIGIQWSVSLVSIIYLAIAGAVFVVGFKSRLKVPDMSPVWRFLAANARPKRILRGITMLLPSLLWVLMHPIRSALGAGKGIARISVGLAGVSILALFVASFLIPAFGSWNRKILNSGVFLYADNYSSGAWDLGDRLGDQGQLLYYDDGLMATVAVYDEANGDRSLTIGGKVDATAFGDLPTELMSGHLPMLLHDNPEDVLVVGLGSGITVGAMELYPSLVSVEAVEIEGAVIEAAAYFAEANNHALDHEKLNMIQADARNYVLAQTKRDKKYDVITAEPSNPWMAGNSIMFAREQFELYNKVLRDDGIVCQWVHYYSMGTEDLKTVLATFTDVFPNSTLWRTTSDLLLIGAKDEQSIDFAALNTRLQQTDVKNDLKRMDVDDIYDVLGTFVMGPEALGDFSSGAPMHTDNHPILQFSAPKSLYSDTSLRDNAVNLQLFKQNIEDVESLLVNYGGDANFASKIQAQRDFYANYTEVIVNVNLSDTSKREGNADQQIIYADAALAANEAMLDTGARDAYAHRRVGSIYSMKGELDAAVTHLTQSVALNPTYVPTWVDLAGAHLAKGEPHAAINSYSSALNYVEDNALLYVTRGNVYLQIKNLDAAIADYNTAIELYPQGADAYAYRGKCYLTRGAATENEADLNLALSDIAHSLKLNSKQAVAYTFRGQAYYEFGVLKSDAGDDSAAASYYNRALDEYDKAISFRPDLAIPHMHKGLAYARRNTGDDDSLAYQALSDAIRINDHYVEAFYNRALLAPLMGRHLPSVNWGAVAMEDFLKVAEYAPGTSLAQQSLTSVDELLNWGSLSEEDLQVLEEIVRVAPGTALADKAQAFIDAQ